MTKVYIATGLDNRTEFRIARQAVRGAGGKLTVDWELAGPALPDGPSTFEDRARANAQLRMRGAGDVHGVECADLVVVIIPSPNLVESKLRGTHVELGIAIAMRKRIVLFVHDDVKSSDLHNVFYYHPCVSMRTYYASEDLDGAIYGLVRSVR